MSNIGAKLGWTEAEMAPRRGRVLARGGGAGGPRHRSDRQGDARRNDAEHVRVLEAGRRLPRDQGGRQVKTPVSDEEFWKWCNSWKPCKRCGKKFWGPLCECETRGGK